MLCIGDGGDKRLTLGACEALMVSGLRLAVANLESVSVCEWEA